MSVRKGDHAASLLPNFLSLTRVDRPISNLLLPRDSSFPSSTFCDNLSLFLSASSGRIKQVGNTDINRGVREGFVDLLSVNHPPEPSLSHLLFQPPISTSFPHAASLIFLPSPSL